MSNVMSETHQEQCQQSYAFQDSQASINVPNPMLGTSHEQPQQTNFQDWLQQNRREISFVVQDSQAFEFSFF